MKHTIVHYRRVLLLLLPVVLLATSCANHPFHLWRKESKAQEKTQTKHQTISGQEEPQTTQNAQKVQADATDQTTQISREETTTKPTKKFTNTQRASRTKAAKQPPKDQRALSKKTQQKKHEPSEVRYYASLERKLERIQREIEEGGYILDEANNPKILKKDFLKTYNGFRLTFKAKEGKYLPNIERKVEKDLEERYNKNFRRVYRGKMSKTQEGIYVIDFIPQENLQTYKKLELNMP